MIEVQNLTKRYGSHLAVDNISFNVEEGEVLGFLGPNGAGKTTTMNILTGYLSASNGVAKVNGFDILEQPNEAKKNIGYLPELPPLYLDMTVREYLDFMYDLKKTKLPREKHIAEICKLVKIDNVYGRLIKNLSKGYRQRVGFAQALIGNPPVLVLDEPTVGLDPKQIIEIRSLIKSLGKHHTVILSSHILQEIEAVCDRIIIINKGQLVENDTAANLAKKYSNDRRLVLNIAGAEDDVLHVLSSVPNVVRVTSHGEKEPGVFEYYIEPEEGADIRREVFNRIAARKWCILGMRTMEMSLEEIFITLTREAPVMKQVSTSNRKIGGRN